MKAFIEFNKAMMKQPLPVVLWIMVLMALNMISPLFFLNQLEAKIVLGTIMLSAMLQFGLYLRFGSTRILGLAHILWFPLLAFLFTRLGDHSIEDLFGIWLRALMLVNAVSLVLDTIDVIRWSKGDRSETTVGSA